MDPKSHTNTPTNIPLPCYILDRSTFTNYDFAFNLPEKNKYGGVAILALKQIYEITINPDLKLIKSCSCTKCQVEDLWLNVSCQGKNFTIGTLYRHPNGKIDHFIDQLTTVMNKIPTNNTTIIGGDINIDLLNISNESVLNYASLLMSYGFVPKIHLPTRITDHTCTLIDHIFLRLPKKYSDIITYSGCIFSDISDHLPLLLGLSLTNRPSISRPFIRIINDKTLQNFKNACQNFDWNIMNTYIKGGIVVKMGINLPKQVDCVNQR